jgi:4-alpha-glucanotransferase
MNVPGSDGDNWSWRLTAGQFNATQVRELARMTEVYGRAPE